MNIFECFSGSPIAAVCAQCNQIFSIYMWRRCEKLTQSNRTIRVKASPPAAFLFFTWLWCHYLNTWEIVNRLQSLYTTHEYGIYEWRAVCNDERMWLCKFCFFFFLKIVTIVYWKSLNYINERHTPCIVHHKGIWERRSYICRRRYGSIIAIGDVNKTEKAWKK